MQYVASVSTETSMQEEEDSAVDVEVVVGADGVVAAGVTDGVLDPAMATPASMAKVMVAIFIVEEEY